MPKTETCSIGLTNIHTTLNAAGWVKCMPGGWKRAENGRKSEYVRRTGDVWRAVKCSCSYYGSLAAKDRIHLSCSADITIFFLAFVLLLLLLLCFSFQVRRETSYEMGNLPHHYVRVLFFRKAWNRPFSFLIQSCKLVLGYYTWRILALLSFCKPEPSLAPVASPKCLGECDVTLTQVHVFQEGRKNPPPSNYYTLFSISKADS